MKVRLPGSCRGGSARTGQLHVLRGEEIDRLVEQPALALLDEDHVARVQPTPRAAGDDEGASPAIGQRRDVGDSYCEHVRWCSNGSRLTSISVSTWPEVHTIGWTFDRHLAYGSYHYGCSTCYSATLFSQGHFYFGSGGWNVSHRHPSVSIYVNASGRGSTSASV